MIIMYKTEKKKKKTEKLSKNLIEEQIEKKKS